MKNVLLVLALLLTVAFKTSAQTLQIQPVNSSYATSAPPETNVFYIVTNLCASSPSNCTYTWTVTNGVITTASTGVGLVTVPVKWNNSASNGTISVAVSACNPSSTCTSVTRSTQIRYLGPVGNIKIDGAAQSGSYALNCSVSSFTASVDPVTNATSYQWFLPSGWTYTGSGNSITVTPGSSGGSITVRAMRSDVSGFYTSQTLAITRPSGTGTVTAINGPSPICTSSTFTLNGTAVGSVTWLTSDASKLTINSSGVATRVGSSNGLVTITGRITNGCGTFNVNREVWVGNPILSSVSPSNTTFCTGSTLTISASPSYQQWLNYSWTKTYGSGGNNGYFSSSSTNSYVDFVDYTAEYSTISLNVSNSCGSLSSGASLISQNCFKMAIYPNPATDVIAVEFESAEDKPTFPENILLISEGSGMTMKKVDTNISKSTTDLSKKQKFDLNVSDLPRGTYFLHLLYPSKSNKKSEKVQVVLK
jgi:hypothetical protein